MAGITLKVIESSPQVEWRRFFLFPQIRQLAYRRRPNRAYGIENIDILPLYIRQLCYAGIIERSSLAAAISAPGISSGLGFLWPNFPSKTIAI